MSGAGTLSAAVERAARARRACSAVQATALLPPGLRIEPLRRPDAPAVHRLEATCFSRGAWSEGTLASYAVAASACAVRADAALAGYLLATLRPASLYLVRMAVDPAFRGRGLGRAMLAWGLALGREVGATAVSLHVAEDNAPAVALYRSLDFVVVERLPDFYGGNGAALTMERLP